MTYWQHRYLETGVRAIRQDHRIPEGDGSVDKHLGAGDDVGVVGFRSSGGDAADRGHEQHARGQMWRKIWAS